MAEIRPYTSQVLAGGQIGGRSASAADFGVDMSGLAHGLESATHTMQKVQDDQARLWAYNAVTDQETQLRQQFNDQKNSLDPNDPEFLPKLNKMTSDFNTSILKSSEQTVVQAPNRKSAEYVTQHMATVRRSLMDHAINYQSQTQGQYIVGQFEKAADADRADLMTNPTPENYALKKEKLKSTIGGLSSIDPNLKMRMEKEQLSKLADAADRALAETNPTLYLQTVAPNAVANRMNGTPVGGIPGGAASGGFNGAIQFVLKQEGGYTAKDGKSGFAANFGINQGANPDIDVKNLTKDQAVQIYKQRYWNAIGADNMPPKTALVAFDTAVNMGVPTALRLVKETGGDPDAIIARRREIYNGMANDAGHRPNLKTWLRRMDDLQAQVDAGGPQTVAMAATQDPALVKQSALPWQSDMTPERMIQHISLAETRQNQLMSVNRAQLEQTLKDQTVQAWTTGDVSSPLTPDRFVAAYGQAEGIRKYNDEYKPLLATASTVRQVAGMTVDQQNRTLDSLKPVPNTPGYAEAFKNYEIVTKAVNASREAREADPVTFAIQNKIGNVQELKMNTPKDMADSLVQRAPAVLSLSKDFGTPPRLFTKPEAEALNRALKDMPTSQKIAYLETIRTSVKDQRLYNAAVQQITPDSPVTGFAGTLLTQQDKLAVNHWFKPNESIDPKEVAGVILEGEALLNKSKSDKHQDGNSRGFPMPQEALLRQKFNAEIGNATAGMPDAGDRLYQATRAYYAGMAARRGNLASKDAPDNALLDEAIRNVSGGLYEQNGTKVFMPWGADQTKFKQAMVDDFAKQAKLNGLTGRAADFNLYGLRGAGDGAYYMMSGTDYLRGPNGAPIVITTNGQDVPQPGAVTPAATMGRREVTGKIKR